MRCKALLALVCIESRLGFQPELESAVSAGPKMDPKGLWTSEGDAMMERARERKAGKADGESAAVPRDDVAGANLNRTWSLAGTSIAIFTFTLVFLYPRFYSGEIDPLLFQAALIVIGLSVFSFVFSGVYYYTLTVARSFGIEKPEETRQRGDTFWIVGFSLLVLEPTLILLSVALVAVAMGFLVLGILAFGFTMHKFLEMKSWLGEPE